MQILIVTLILLKMFCPLVNESPTKNQNQSNNSLNILITTNSNKSDFYNSVHTIEVAFDDDDHHVLINSKYFSINEVNDLKTKENHFSFLDLNIASLIEYTLVFPIY